MTIQISSTAFANGAAIPRKFTGDGEDVSPDLRWEDVPEGSVELVLICDDPDAPTTQPWVHWVLYHLPASVSELPEGMPTATRIELPVQAFQGRNSWTSGRTTGYRGPAPPARHGVHHYHFKLYAVDCDLGLHPGVDKAAVEYAMRDHILDRGELIGTYQRP
jgi:Raf kinase inhibitor-like YbhB/YbcL family protein